MKNTSFITTVVAALAVAMSSALAQVNPWQTLEGSISLKGLGTDEQGIAYSDVKVSLKLGTQASGPQVVGPAEGSSVGINGSTAKLGKVTNKEVLAQAGLDPKGLKIAWARVGGVPILVAYNKSGVVAPIPFDVLQADVAWANNYAGTYGGTATLTATPTASGTSVYVADGKVTGLTEIYGIYAEYLDFGGVGKYTSDARKQLSVKAKVSGLSDTTPTP